MSVYNSRYTIFHVYQSQLDKFKRIGLGNETEFGTMITQDLIDITEKRLNQLYLGVRRHVKK